MANKVCLQKHLPAFMCELREMDALLDAENPEFDGFIAKMETALEDCFIATASKEAIGRYERIMGLRPVPGETLGKRRLRISLANARADRFSLDQFVKSAAQLGETIRVEMISAHEILLEFISADADNIGLLSNELRLSIPAGLEVRLHNAFELTGGGFAGGALCLSQSYTFGGVNT